jgi:hypothetical protein
MDNFEIRRCMLEVDDEKLSIDDLKAIGKQLPTSEEVSLYQFFISSSYILLDRANQVIWRRR